jgi:copper(I)-binding protein
MKEARDDIAELKARVKEAWKTDSSEQKKVEGAFEKIEATSDDALTTEVLGAEAVAKPEVHDATAESQAKSVEA